MVARVNKVYNNSVSVRGYIIDKCHSKGEGLWIRYGDEQMYVPHKDLKSGVPNGYKIPSKFTNSTYDLIDFKWKPRPSKIVDKNAEGQLIL